MGVGSGLGVSGCLTILDVPLRKSFRCSVYNADKPSGKSFSPVIAFTHLHQIKASALLLQIMPS